MLYGSAAVQHRRRGTCICWWRVVGCVVVLYNTLSNSKLPRLQSVGNYHITMPGGQVVSPPMLGVMPCQYTEHSPKLESVGYPAVKTASSCVHLFGHNTFVWDIAVAKTALSIAHAVKMNRAILCLLNSQHHHHHHHHHHHQLSLIKHSWQTQQCVQCKEQNEIDGKIGAVDKN